LNNTIDMRAHRLRARISLRKMAAQMSVSVAMVQKWDHGAQPKADKLPLLVEVFGLDRIEDLYRVPV
jgi:DNA-binding transcriptional regulator YiaG